MWESHGMNFFQASYSLHRPLPQTVLQLAMNLGWMFQKGLILEIGLVANKKTESIAGSVFINYLHPIPDLFERFTVGDVINNGNVARPSIL
jgi:hypothetical protein